MRLASCVVTSMTAISLMACSGSEGDGDPLPSFNPGAAGSAASPGPSSTAPGATVTPKSPAPGSSLDRPQDGPVQMVPAGTGGTGSTAPVAGAGGTGTVTTPPEPRTLENVLVFSRTTGFRHDSIPAGIALV